MSRQVLREAIGLLERRIPFALCTVVSAKGSVPGKAGARMLVFEDGAFQGTVGGAGLEEKVKTLAREALRTGKSDVHRFDLAMHRPGALSSLCGGIVEVHIEPMLPRPHVLLLGGGHVAYEVYLLCPRLEFEVSVLDDRPEYASRERFPQARGLWVAKPNDWFPTADLSPYSHALIMGYSHALDSDAVYHCLARFPGWIGVIASNAKVKEFKKRMVERGLPPAASDRVEWPVGLALGAETPAEIAIAIVGSLLKDFKLRGAAPQAAATATSAPAVGPAAAAGESGVPAAAPGGGSEP
ncbi:MAG: XdhC family protein [Planctomycetes bacterium]|nr:XdhC family protein [Planctomycetota bacterium]